MDPNQQNVNNLQPSAQNVKSLDQKQKSRWLYYAGIGIIIFMFLGTFAIGGYVVVQKKSITQKEVNKDSSVVSSSQDKDVNQLNSSVDVSSWNTLESKKCALSLKYPSTFTVNEGKFSCTVVIGDEQSKYYSFILVGASTKKSDADASSSADIYLEKFYSQNPKNIKKIKVGDMNGYQVSSTMSNGSEMLQIIFGKKTTIYSVNANYLKTNPKAKSLSEDIVSTIRINGNPEEVIKPLDLIMKAATALSQANNTKRKSDINAILNAVHQYSADNKGQVPSAIDQMPKEIGSSGVNICSILVSKYLYAFPTDPLSNSKGKNISDCLTDYETGYLIVKASSNKITVYAPHAELGETIFVTR